MITLESIKSFSLVQEIRLPVSTEEMFHNGDKKWNIVPLATNKHLIDIVYNVVQSTVQRIENNSCC